MKVFLPLDNDYMQCSNYGQVVEICIFFLYVGFGLSSKKAVMKHGWREISELRLFAVKVRATGTQEVFELRPLVLELETSRR